MTYSAANACRTLMPSDVLLQVCMTWAISQQSAGQQTVSSQAVLAVVMKESETAVASRLLIVTRQHQPVLIAAVICMHVYHCVAETL